MINHLRLFLVVFTAMLSFTLEAASPRLHIHGGVESSHSSSSQKLTIHNNQRSIPRVIHKELPVEAHQTLESINKGGPFHYPKDGTIFHNREENLPVKELGYYREYTVETPSATDRGARRIAVGKDGERYYTDDHYQTFKEITE